MEIRWADGLKITGNTVASHVAALLNRPIREFYSGIRPLQGEERAAAVAEFKNMLCGLVDQWIGSGRVNEAVTGDEPLTRNIYWRSELYPKPLFETVVKFWAAHPARATVEPDGSPVFHLGPAESLESESEDSLGWARKRAVLEFARLLASPAPQRLFRCDGCARYFVRQRVPRKAIFHGSYCAKCTSKGGARRVEDSRKQAAQEKIRRAADALEQWKPGRRRFGEKAAWVVKQVNAALPKGETVKVNWFTWHQKEIESEVKRRNHAKS